MAETHVDLERLAIRETTHVALGEEAVGEERQEDKLGKSEELVAGEDETGPAEGRETLAMSRPVSDLQQEGP